MKDRVDSKFILFFIGGLIMYKELKAINFEFAEMTLIHDKDANDDRIIYRVYKGDDFRVSHPINIITLKTAILLDNGVIFHPIFCEMNIRFIDYPRGINFVEDVLIREEKNGILVGKIMTVDELFFKCYPSLSPIDLEVINTCMKIKENFKNEYFRGKDIKSINIIDCI